MEHQLRPYEIKDSRFWKITIGLTLASMLNFANLYVTQPLLPIFTREFQISPTFSSLAISLTTFSLVFGLLFFGFLSDRIGRLVILKWTLMISIIPLFVIPLVPHFWWILGWRFITGVTIAGLPAVAVAYISEEISYQAQGLAVSFYIASNALGGMFGRVLSGQFADSFSWQAGFYTLGIFGLIVSFLCLWMLPKSRFFKQHNRSYKQDIAGMAVHFKNPKLAFAFLFGFMLQVAFSAVWTYLPFYLEKEPFYLSIQIISLLYMTYFFGVIGSPVAGRLATRNNLITIIIVGLLIMLLGTAVTTVTQLFYVVLGLSLVCLGFFIVHSLVSTWVGTTATHHKSGATSFYLFSYYMGTTIGGTAVGGVWSHFGWLGVVSVSVILPAISGIFFIIVARSKKTIKEDAK
ncbi:MFS transporter [Robertmurraya massiliosenegalensis]|uniref:MFS transporter n=1 Tax=Robertmurraya TaxID=2837507 RepID=UPI0039A6BF38